MQVVDAPVGARVMVIAAHPDDVESWCGGTLALAIDNGCQVNLLLVTSGDKGSRERGADPRAVGMQREREAREAAGGLGINDITFLRYPDGEVDDTRRLRSDLVGWIRRWKPQVLFTHDPEHPFPPYFSHRDHRVTGRVALDAVYPLARDPLAFPEQAVDGLAAHAVSEVWLFASAIASSYVDISAGLDRKVHARLAHTSQNPDPAALADNWRLRAASTGAEAGLSMAESFTVLRIG